MKRMMGLVILGLVLLCSVSILADTRGLGTPDTLDLVYSVTPDATTNQLQVQLDLYVFSDSNHVLGATAGFSWDNPNLMLDSAVATPLVTDNFEIGPFFFEDGDLALTNANQRFLFAASIMFGAGLPPGEGRRLWASYYFTLSEWDSQDQIIIDTLEYSASTIYKFVGSDGAGDYFPYWRGPIVQYDSSYTPLVNLIVNPDSLHFSGIQGGATPPAQTFTVSTDGTPVDINLVEDADWLIVSPVSGTTTLSPMVSVNSIGLSAGMYIDTIEVVSAEAENSPQYVVVTLELQEPPPVIDVDPGEFYFNAIAGGANPASKTMLVTNAGGSILSWTAVKSQPWLTVAPSSGGDGSTVTLSVDITGLAYDDYVDTVVISDPTATNSPVLVPVFLSVGSDLPIIEVDSAFNTIIVEVPVISIPNRTLTIRNGGAGAMNFWLEESSPRVLTMAPSSGSAPQDVELTFKIPGGTAGNDYYDTVWVYSNEAVNSPFPVVLYFHYTDNPAYLHVNFTTMNLSVYECSQGYGAIPNSRNFLVSNLGGEDPMAFNLHYESDYFIVSAESGVAPMAIMVTPQDLQLPIGTYLDTIIVEAPTAINSPHILEVAYTVIAGTETPEIKLPISSYVIPTQENTGPTPPATLEIWNKYGGCMEWELAEDVPWLYPDIIDGIAPSAVSFNLNSTGFLFGEYVDTFQVVAPAASNTPEDVIVKMRVWRFHGDVDYDAQITILDLVYLVEYMFNQGPQPQPQLVVGDVTCDLLITIEDLVYLVDYMFNQGPIPCGNPY